MRERGGTPEQSNGHSLAAMDGRGPMRPGIVWLLVSLLLLVARVCDSIKVRLDELIYHR